MPKKRKEELVYFIILIFLFTVYEYEILKSYSNLVFETTVSAYSGFFYPAMALMFVLCIFLIIKERNLSQKLNKNPLVHFYAGYSLYIYIIGLIGSLFIVSLSGASANFFRTSFPLLFFVVVYILTLKINDEKKQLIIFAVSFLILVYDYYLNYQNRSVLTVVYAQTITSYFILYLLPLLLCSKNKVLKIVFCIIVTIVVLSSAKKAGTIALIAGLYVYFMISSLAKADSKSSVLKFVIVFVIMILAAYGINYWFESSDAVIAQRMSRFDEEGVISRTLIWTTVLDRVMDTNPIALLFGHGYDAVGLLSKDHLGAHNDFLEILYDFGIIAFCAYCVLYIKLFKKVRRLIKTHSAYAAPLGMSLTVFLIESISSQIVTAPFFGVMFSMTWAFIFAQSDIENKKVRI